MLHLVGDDMKDFDAIHDLKRERIAGRDHDGLVVPPREPGCERFHIHWTAAVGWCPIRTLVLGALCTSRRALALWRFGRSSLCTACQCSDATNRGRGET